jgi:serine/threonine protein kinase
MENFRGVFHYITIFNIINCCLIFIYNINYYCLFYFRLNVIHKKHFIHRDFHSGNILLAHQTWLICDLGLSLPANYNLSNNEVYGVIPYIEPEIFMGGTFSKESDIYSISMIMWEFTTGCKPFANIEHDVNLIYKIIDGKRPEITKDTPECFANLMKRCWDSDPSKRPLITEITESLNDWNHNNKYVELFKQAERKRLELIQLKQLGPEFSEKTHPGAIYTSRPLSYLISNLSSMKSFNVKQGMYYIL